MKGSNTFAGTGSHTFPTSGKGQAKLTVTGVFVGTIVAEYSTDGFVTTQTLPILKSDGTFVQSVTTTGTYYLPFIPTDGIGQIRARVSAYTSGAPVTNIDVG